MADENRELPWDDISMARNLLLTRSDWTQLPDSSLSKSCVIAWRLWRREIRKINKEYFNRRLSAVKRLTELKITKPKLEYAKDELYFEKEGPIISRIDVKKQILEILAEVRQEDTPQKPIQEDTPQKPIEAPIEDYLDTIDDIKLGRKHAQNEAEAVYRKKIRAKSPAIEINVLYTERLNEAIDFLSGVGSNFPLLELLSVTLDKNLDSVATSILKTHSNTISNFVSIESDYIDVLKQIKEADTIPKLKRILEEYNGH
jgi:hypothetical protein